MHAALGQTYDLAGVKGDTNTAAIIHVPEHPNIENTLPSMRAAFHDDILDYRTDTGGPISAYDMEELRQLDVGYGHTADNGGTFPSTEMISLWISFNSDTRK